MNLIDIILLAIALGIDCLVVSFSQGLIFAERRTENSLKLAFTMGLFQGGMPCIGYWAVEYVSGLVEPVSKWFVFAIFFVLGLKFVFEAFQKKREDICCIGLKCLISLGIATGIDALVSGASLNLTGTSLLFSSFVIGAMSLVMSLCGFWAGNLLRFFSAKFLEISGGVILIFLAFKSLIF